MKAKIFTAPVIEPISIAELRLHLRIDAETVEDHEEDSLLTDLIASARYHVENVTRRALLSQTWDYYLDDWPADAITLPFGNLQSVTSVKYKDTAGTETTLVLTTDYYVETNGEGFGRVVLPYGESWPSDTLYTSNPITIRFVCGWTTAALIPGNIKAAVKMICADLYSNRESQVYGQHEYQENRTVNNLLASHRLWGEF